MASFWGCVLAATAIMIHSTMGSAIGAMPSQTLGGFGMVFSPEPTEAPSMELVKAKMAKRSLTNVCTEWTIPGGYGQPQCSNSETCLFHTAANGFYYEGCGETSIAYDWVTACYGYPEVGTPGVSEIFCPETAPHCGFFGFVFAQDATFYNWGCSTVGYELYVELVQTTTDTGSPIVLNGGGTTQITDTASGVAVTQTQSAMTSKSTTTGSSDASTTTNPATSPHTASKVPVGAIAGGVGGVVAVAFLAFLLWFCMRQRKEDKAKKDAASVPAFQSNDHASELGGTNATPFAGAFAPPGPEKNGSVVRGQEIYQNQQPSPPYLGYANDKPTAPSYGQPQPTPSPGPYLPSPMQQYSELASQNMQVTPMSVPPVSPIVTTASSTPLPQTYQQFQPPPQPQAHEIGAGTEAAKIPQPPQSPPPPHLMQQQHQYSEGMLEMSATAPSLVPKLPPGPPPGQATYMNGAPMSEEWNGRHELA